MAINRAAPHRAPAFSSTFSADAKPAASSSEPVDQLEPPKGSHAGRGRTRKGSAPKPVKPKLTPLQKHCAYFDRNGDGKITPRETFDACRAMGMNLPLTLATTVLIHVPMGLGTSKGPLPSLDISLDNVHRGMHGSDTEVYDEDGHFDAHRFDRMFSKYDTDHDDHWSLQELWNRSAAQRDLLDIFGRVASFAEFALVYLALGESKISRSSLRKVYDGSLFYELEARHQRG